MKNREAHDSEGHLQQCAGRRHMPSGRWSYGLSLSGLAVVLWSTVPIALSLLLDGMNAITVTWYRFAAGACLLGGYLAWRRRLPSVPNMLSGNGKYLVAMAGIGLAGNFVLYLYALNFIPPGASQVVMQLAPLFVVLGGVVLFRESFRRLQWLGLVLLVLGLLLFFNRRLSEFSGRMTDYTFGAILVMSAALVWASYALAQKQLLKSTSSSGIMLVLYAIGVLLMLPFSSLEQISGLTTLQYYVLAYSTVNVLVGYGCFAEALEHWEASRVSAVVCTTPLLTLILTHPAHLLWPDRIMPDNLNTPGLCGAVLTVAGSMLSALGGHRTPNDTD